MLVGPQEEQVGRRVDDPQPAVDLERIGHEWEGEALRRYDLEYVAGSNVGARALDELVVLLPRDVRAHLSALVRPFRGKRRRERASQQRDHALDRLETGVVGGGGLGRALDRHHLDHEQRLRPPVVDEQRLREPEEALRQPEFVRIPVRQALHVAHPVVREVADRPSHQGRQPGQLGQAELLQQRAQVIQRIDAAVRGNRKPLDAPAAPDLQCVAARRKRGAGADANEAVAAPGLAPLVRLEQEGRRAVVDLLEDRQRGVEVG